MSSDSKPESPFVIWNVPRPVRLRFVAACVLQDRRVGDVISDILTDWCNKQDARLQKTRKEVRNPDTRG